LATAIRAVNAGYARLSPQTRKRIDLSNDPREAEINEAIKAGDDRRARIAIDAWRNHWLGRFDRVGVAA
jgi:hypothetical protein